MSERCCVPDEILDLQREMLLAGQRPRVADLLQGTSFEKDREAQLDLVYHEVVVLEELGKHPDLRAYVQKYPHLQEDLELHFQIHEAMNVELLGDTRLPWKQTSSPRRKSLPDEPDLALDNYNVGHMLGQGGMATVYQARHLTLHRDVALKIFQSGGALTLREMARIKTEAQAIARLSHPNIVQIFEIGEHAGMPFMALELAPQGTLAQKLQRSSYTAWAACDLIETLARALHHAHQRGVIHRDLKPANILFAGDGTPKITDFGLAKVMQDGILSGPEMTRSGDAMGTPRYMAPEQALGKHSLVGPRTDVYALGTVLYECLTGRAPFVSASVVETLQKITCDDPLPLRRLQPSIPRDLETVCLHCLQKEPERRFGTAEELADELRRFRQGEPIRIKPVPNWEKGWKWCRRFPAHAGLLAIVLVACVGSIAFAAFKSHRESVRLGNIRREVSNLMQRGQVAIEDGRMEEAQSAFQSAWATVQAEPALEDHRMSVAGWLDHARNANARHHWNRRIPPREFDDRRDIAMLLSLLVLPGVRNQDVKAREAIQAALELTVPGDAAGKRERESLLMLDATLIEHRDGPAMAVKRLDQNHESFKSHEFLVFKSGLLKSVGEIDEAGRTREHAEQYPPNANQFRLQAAMEKVRAGDFLPALNDFEQILFEEPEHFTARLFHAVCLLKLNRPKEAQIALTACIAQRPLFGWSYYFRSQSFQLLQNPESARVDLQRLLDCRPDALQQFMALMDLGRINLLELLPEEAREAFEKATKACPDEPIGWDYMGWTELLLGSLAPARRHFQESMKIQANDPVAMLGLNVIRMVAGGEDDPAH